MIPTEVIPGHTTGTTNGITGVIDDAHTQVLIHIVLTMTLTTTDHLHLELFSLLQRQQQIILSISLKTC